MQNYTNTSSNMDTTNIFPIISLDFCTEFLLFPPQKKSIVLPIQLDIIVNIVSNLSKAMNYNFAKFHAFIKKLTSDVIFRWL